LADRQRTQQWKQKWFRDAILLLHSPDRLSLAGPISRKGKPVGNLTELDGLIAIDDLEPHGVRACDNAALDVWRNRRPGGDATGEHRAINVDDIEAWARHARGVNGLAGDAEAGASAAPSSYELHRAARIDRAFTLAEIIAEMVWAVGAFVGQAYARHRQRRQASSLRDALRQLDDHTLRDLGFDRSEISSVVAEVTGEAERTRLRVVLAPYDPRW
jgi:uncharacterized protein YjiS (DUF1127 family)